MIDPGPEVYLDMEYLPEYPPPNPTWVRVSTESLSRMFVWERDVGRLREALLTCPAIVMEHY